MSIEHFTDRFYDVNFFDSLEEGSLRSARVVVPIVVELVRPRSVVDFGCGRGAWLKVFRENDIETVLGLDGNYVDPRQLLFPAGCFRAVDLAQTFDLQRRYDLALSLEVAEHLPRSSARRFVQQLTNAADAVLFSAAIPGQGGTRHVNEQWPCFWQKLFANEGFRPWDPVRPRIQHDRRVDWWYRQNLIFYVSERLAASSQRLPVEGTEASLEWVHVSILQQHESFRGIRHLLSRAIESGVRRHFSRLRKQ
jgi:hypothetical protein